MKIIRLDEIPEEAVSHNPRVKKKIMLRAGEVSRLASFARAVFPPGEVAGAHSHERMSEVFFIESGTGIIRVDGKEYGLEKGACVAVLPGETHEVVNSGQEDLVIIYF